MIKNKYITFTGFVILNLILKSIFCNWTPFSFDEIISIKDTVLDFGHIKHESEWDNNPPFYYYCIWVWHRILPVTEFNSRFLSVIFVSLAIGLFYLLIRKQLSNKTALLTCALLTLSNFITYYAQETRAYGLVLLLSAISGILFFNFLENNSKKNVLFLSFINFLLIYTHYIAALIPFFQLITIIVSNRQLILKFSLWNFFVIGLLVYLRFTKKQYLNIFGFNTKNDFWLQTASLKDLTSAFKQLYFGPYIASALLILSVFFILSKLNKGKKYSTQEVYFLSLGFGSIALLFLIGCFKSVFLSRYLIYTVPLGTALIINYLIQFKKTSLYIIPVFFIPPLINLQLKKESGSNFKYVTDQLKLIRKSGDIVIINKRDNIGQFEFYHDKNLFLKYKNIDSVCKSLNVFGLNDTAEIQTERIGKGAKIYLIQSFHKLNTTQNVFLDFLNRRAVLLRTDNSIKGVEMSVFLNCK